MIDLASLILGPLAIPECRRSAGRAWIILVRALAGGALAVSALAFLWFWWFSAEMDPYFLPFGTLRIGVQTLEFMAVSIALVMGPALMAGSLAGEKERGSLGLLLTTRVNSLEIVTGRVAGKMCQVGILLAAGLPALVLIASLAGMRAGGFLALLGLPLAVAFGGVGISAAASAVSRRGRDALLSVYLMILLLLLSPLATQRPGPVGWLALANPYLGIDELAWGEDAGPASTSILIWTVAGLLGIGLAAWRLAPSCLRLLSGDVARGRRGGRRWWVPKVGDGDPMLWKELHIERVGTLGRVGRWIGLIIILWLVLASTILAALIGYYRLVRFDEALDSYYAGMLGDVIATPRRFVSFLVEVALGLRAAVAISSERERGTWDALLTSPLEGREIIVGKLWGSLYSLRWLFAAALWAWGLCIVCGALTPKQFFYQLYATLAVGAFMVAVGVRASLATATATRSMAITMGIWLGALAAFSVIAGFLLLLGTLAILSGFGIASQYDLTTMNAAGRWVGLLWSEGWPITYPTLYVLATAAIVAECRLRFDRIAGRMAGGELAVRVDRLLHGQPMEPVPIGGGEVLVKR